MSLLSPAFNTGTYTVTRTPAGGTSLDGHWTRPAPTTLTIDGSVQPLSGRALRDLKEGQRADDMRWIYTDQPLFTTDQNHAYQDVVSIDDDSGTFEPYRVIKVEHFRVISGHYRATVEKMSVP